MPKIRVLVVDDNKAFTDLMSGAFGDEFEVQTAEDAALGLKKCSEWQPQVVLLDINMPSMNGIEFMRRMSLDRNTANIPVIVITASDFNGITESLARRHHNLFAFMTKLSPVETIREKVLKASER
jgi:CheY-like chemotaxis protein